MTSEQSVFHGLRKVALRLLGDATEMYDKLFENDETVTAAKAQCYLELAKAHVEVARLFHD